MSNDDTKRGSGILNSLKKLIFEDDQPQQSQRPQTPSAPAPNAIPNTPYKEPSYSPATPTTGKTPPPIPITANDGTTDLKEMKLNFGAFDFVVTPSGEYFFLECNPNGQWLWIEMRTGLKISEAITEVLSDFKRIEIYS